MLDERAGDRIDDRFDARHRARRRPPERRRSIARPLANRLPATLRAAALRLLELALREDLGDVVLALDPEHPQALLARFERGAPHGKDFALLRRVIASAPGWARPYELLDAADASPDDADHADAASRRSPPPGSPRCTGPATSRCSSAAAAALDDAGRTDEGLRLLERAVALDGENPRAHLALRRSAQGDRPGRTRGSRARCARRASTAARWIRCCRGTPIRSTSICARRPRCSTSAGSTRRSRCARTASHGREAAWPSQTRALDQWRKDPRFVAWCYAREGYFRGDDARAVEGFGRIEPDDSVDLAIFLDALVALGREDEVPLAWAQFGLGRGLHGPVARLAAARSLMAAGDCRRGVEELWRVELTEPGRDEHVAIARAGLVMSGAPIDVIEAALGERIAIGAPTLARRMARDVADFVPAAAKSALVAARARQARSRSSSIRRGSRALPPRRAAGAAIDALFAELCPRSHASAAGFDIADELQRRRSAGQPLARGRVHRGRRRTIAPRSRRPPRTPPRKHSAATSRRRRRCRSTIAGALRTVAGEALALVRQHRDALGDRDARALLGVLDPLLRRVDRWIGTTWLATVERSLGIDERSRR